MRITVNGTSRDLPPGTFVASVVDQPVGVAVALNGEVLPRDEWSRVALMPDDAVEVVTAKQGG